MVMSGHLYSPAALPPEKNPIPVDDRVGLRAGLVAWEKRNISLSCQDSNTESSSP
jgi:hypothetical protein